MRVLNLLCALLLLLFVVVVVDVSAEEAATNPFAGLNKEALKYASPVLKCVKDMERLCEKDGSEDPWKCMLRRRDEIGNAECRLWVQGMAACEADAMEKEGCLTPATSYIVSLRRCVRTLDEATEVSQACRTSNFYMNLKILRTYGQNAQAQQAKAK